MSGATKAAAHINDHGLSVTIPDSKTSLPIEGLLKQDTTHEEGTTKKKSKTQIVEAETPRPKAIGMRFGISPLPNHASPTAEEAYEVYRILTKHHGVYERPEEYGIPSATIAGCGNVPYILEAICRTIISSATNMKNANTAIVSLLEAFPRFKSGPFIGSVDWNIVRLANPQTLADAIRRAGKGNQNTVLIQKTLNMVWKQNEEKRKQLLAAQQNMSTLDVPDEVLQSASVEDPVRAHILTTIAKETLLKHPDVLTLDYMHAWKTKDAFDALVQYAGVGPKVAACVLLFCMDRPVFPVDTHCYRLCRGLKWVPSEKINETKTFAHCDVKLPNELKYSLHQLFIAHGQQCKRCMDPPTATEDDPECVLEHLIDRKLLPSAKKQKSTKRRANNKGTISKPSDVSEGPDSETEEAPDEEEVEEKEEHDTETTPKRRKPSKRTRAVPKKKTRKTKAAVSPSVQSAGGESWEMLVDEGDDYVSDFDEHSEYDPSQD